MLLLATSLLVPCVLTPCATLPLCVPRCSTRVLHTTSSQGPLKGGGVLPCLYSASESLSLGCCLFLGILWLPMHLLAPCSALLIIPARQDVGYVACVHLVHCQAVFKLHTVRSVSLTRMIRSTMQGCQEVPG